MEAQDWDSLELKPNPAGGLQPTGVSPLDHLLAAIRPQHRERVARAVEAGYGVGFGEVGFSFPEDRDEDDDEGEGVEIYDPFVSIYLDQEPFQRLMRRALAMLFDG